jgi:hypothetical protein
MRRLVTVMVGILALGLLAGCGGSSSKKGDSSGGVFGSGGSSDSSGGGSNGGGSSTGNSDLDALIAKAKSANVKVTYKSSGSSDDFTLIQYHGDSAFISGDSGYYTSNGKSVSCSDLKGSTPTCQELPGGANLGQTMTAAFFGVYSAIFTSSSKLGSLGVDVSKSTSNETIAGRSAECVKISGSALGTSGSLTACIDKETGVFFKGSTTASDSESSSVEATAFADSSADDVKPPAGATTTQITLPEGLTIPTTP